MTDPSLPLPVFVSENDFRNDPLKYMEMATTEQRVAVFDDNDTLVISMGGTYPVPDDEVESDFARIVRQAIEHLRKPNERSKSQFEERRLLPGWLDWMSCNITDEQWIEKLEKLL